MFERLAQMAKVRQQIGWNIVRRLTEQEREKLAKRIFDLPGDPYPHAAPHNLIFLPLEALEASYEATTTCPCEFCRKLRPVFDKIMKRKK